MSDLFDQDKAVDPRAKLLDDEPLSGYKSWKEKAVVLGAAMLLAGMAGLFAAVDDTADAADDAKTAAETSTAETLTNRSFGYQSRALTCVAIMRLGVSMVDLPTPCLDPNVVVHYEPAP